MKIVQLFRKMVSEVKHSFSPSQAGHEKENMADKKGTNHSKKIRRRKKERKKYIG